MKILKICFFGPAGSGKNTAAEILENILSESNPDSVIYQHNIADPLVSVNYHINKLFKLDGKDNLLIQKLAEHYEGVLGEYYIKELFKIISMEEAMNSDKKSSRSLPETDYLLIINSDCRNNCYDYLKANGFIFIKIETNPDCRLNRINNRDEIKANLNNKIENTDLIKADLTIENNGTTNQLKEEIKLKVLPCLER